MSTSADKCSRVRASVWVLQLYTVVVEYYFMSTLTEKSVMTMRIQLCFTQVIVMICYLKTNVSKHQCCNWYVLWTALTVSACIQLRAPPIILVLWMHPGRVLWVRPFRRGFIWKQVDGSPKVIISDEVLVGVILFRSFGRKYDRICLNVKKFFDNVEYFFIGKR